MSEGEDARVIGVDSDDADDLIGALSSDTARNILAELHDEAATPSEVADRTDTTVQNARYHLENLTEAGLIDVEGTRYSPKGREMDVYAPSEPLVMFVGREEDSTSLRDALTRFLGTVGLIGVAAVFVEYLFRLYAPEDIGLTDDAYQMEEEDDVGAFIEEDVEDAPVEEDDAPVDDVEEEDAAMEIGDMIVEAVLDLPPGVVFFVSAAAVALVGFAVWYAKEGRNR